MKSITINENWCKRCGICVEGCPAKVFTRERDGLPVAQDIEKCTVCKLCVLRCPDFAIELEVSKDEK